MHAFEKANITSVVPVMLLPRQVLMEFDGIGERTAAYITKALAQKGLAHRQLCDRLGDFIDQQFGCIENAPVSALNVVSLRNNVTARPYYAPLLLLLLIEQVNPHFTVGELAAADNDELLAMVEERIVFGPRVHRLKGDAIDINWRLSHWYFNSAIAVFGCNAQHHYHSTQKLS